MAPKLILTVSEVEQLVADFRESGIDMVYVTYCCHRVYVGTRQPKKCRTCARVIEVSQRSTVAEEWTF